MKLSNFIEGLKIIQRHERDDYCLRAEHDQFWASNAELALPPADSAALEKLGWFKDEDADGWSAWV